MARTIYKCRNPKCGATDSDSGNNNPAPVALICWRCKHGSGMSVAQQFQQGVGMLPVVEQPEH